MKKFVENIDPEIFWVTILLILSVVLDAALSTNNFLGYEENNGANKDTV